MTLHFPTYPNLNPQEDLNTLSLAHLGDGVYELLCRSYMSKTFGHDPNSLHKNTVNVVCAQAQSQAYEVLFPQLTPKEQSVLKRGRNNTNAKVPKSASCMDYRKATGVECLFGWLYVMGESQRIEQLFTLVSQDFELKLLKG